MALNPIEVICSSFEDICAAIERLDSNQSLWIFRGQSDSTWGLEPRLERFCRGAGGSLDMYEDAMLNEFRAKAHLYAGGSLPVNEGHSNDVWRAMMQHHGLPTRLLDWSYSAYIALYFAVAEEPQSSSSAIWAFDLVDLARFDTDNSEQDYIEHVEPRLHVSRLASQQGCFLRNKRGGATFEESMAAHMQCCQYDWLYKICFPTFIRDEIRKRLLRLNIHPATLFPDLDGLARLITLKQELSIRRVIL